MPERSWLETSGEDAEALVEPGRWRGPAVFALALGLYALTTAGRCASLEALFREPPGHAVAQADAWLHGQLHLLDSEGLYDVTRVGGRTYSSFPPGPALVLLPFVAVFGTAALVWPVQCAVAALGVMWVDRLSWLASGRFGLPLGPSGRDALTVLYGAGTLVWITVASQGVYFLAHHLAAAGLAGALAYGLAGRFGRAGLAYAAALASRPVVIGALPLLVYLLWVGAGNEGPRPAVRARLRRALAAGWAPVLVCGFMAWQNARRFGSPLDFGYGRMEVNIYVEADRAEYGLLSLRRIPINAWWFFLAPPAVESRPPFIRSREDGMAVWFITPAFLLVFRRWPRAVWHRLTWLSLLLVLLPGLMYFNTGWVQYGPRFLIDLHPLAMLLVLPALVPRPGVGARALIAASVVLTAIGVWQEHWAWRAGG